MMSSEEDPDPGIECHNSKGLGNSSKVKTKRVRQRVDAGEPRNSYASIPNFSSRPPSQQQHSPGSLASLSPYHSNGFASKMLQSIYDEKGLHPLMMLEGVDRNGSSLNGAGLQNPPGRLYVNGGSPICDLNTFYGGGHNRTMGGMSPDSPPTPERSSSNGSGTSSNSHLLRDILQQGRKYGGSNGGAVTPPAHVSAGPHSSKGSGVTSAGHGREDPPRLNERELTEREEEEEEEVITEGESEGAGPEERRDNAGNPSEAVPVRNQESPQPSHTDEIRQSSNTSMMRMMSDLSPQQPPPPPVPRCSSPVSTAVLSPSGDGNNSLSLAVPNHSPVDTAAISPASSPALSCCSPRSAAATPNWQSANVVPNLSSQTNSNCIASNDLEVKRARVETIVNNMLQGPVKSQGSGSCPGEQPTPVNGCKKRKLYQPQQHEMSRATTAMIGVNGDVDESFDDEDDEDCIREPSPKRRGTDLLIFREQLRQMQDQLVAMRQQYIEMVDRDSAEEDDDANNLNSLAIPVSHVNNNSRARHRSINVSNDQRSPDNSDYEEHKPRILDVNKDHRGPLDTSRSKGIYIDYDNTSLYEDQKRVVIDQDNHNKVPGATRPSQHEQSASSEDGLKAGLKDICRQSCIVQPPSCFSGLNMDYNWLAESLKAELSTSLAQIVDEVMSRCAQRKPTSKNLDGGHNSTTPCSEPEPAKDPTLLSQMLDRKSPRTKVIDRGARVNGHGLGAGLRASPYPQDIVSSVPKPPFFFPFKPPTSIAAATAAFLYGSPPQMPSSLSLVQPSYLSSPPVHHPSVSTPLSSSLDAPEQTEPVSLVVTPKKKRHKVTDTRLNPRGPLQLGGPLRSNGLNSQDSQDVSPKYSGMLSSLSSDGLTPSQHLYSHHPPPPPPPLVPVSLPTSVAIPNPSLNQSDFFHGFSYDPHSRMSQYSIDHQDEDMGGGGGGGLLRNSTPTNSIHHPLLPSHGSGSGGLSHHPQRGSPDSLHYSHMKQDSGDISDAGDSPAAYDSGMPMISFLPMMHTSTLTPMHLRKAKLMFFYARYPSSAVLKMYFPDIKFNKNNTAQLVKWFSNFREFYYIQMEKYARQAMSEGIKASEDLKVTPDSELLRVLNLHYNRNNHIEAPENFRFVVEQTLREFFKALVAGKDTEQSWKKSIYKIIARLDDNVPEYFKSPNFLETLE